MCDGHTGWLDTRIGMDTLVKIDDEARAPHKASVRHAPRRKWRSEPSSAGQETIRVARGCWTRPHASCAPTSNGLRAIARIPASTLRARSRKSADTTKWSSCATSRSCPIVSTTWRRSWPCPWLSAAHQGCRHLEVGTLIEVYARRLQIQEALTAEIADTLERVLAPHGVAVVLEGAHGCMRAGASVDRRRRCDEPHARCLPRQSRDAARISVAINCRGLAAAGRVAA